MKSFLVALTMSVVAPLVSAQVAVNDPWVRGTVPHQTATGAFMQLTAKSDSRLVSAQTIAASRVEIHEMKMENDVMKMRQIDGLSLPADKTVELKPGGLHLMLMGLKSDLKEGQTVPVTLVFETKNKERQTVELNVPVRALNNSAAGHPHGGH